MRRISVLASVIVCALALPAAAAPSKQDLLDAKVKYKEASKQFTQGENDAALNTAVTDADRHVAPGFGGKDARQVHYLEQGRGRATLRKTDAAVLTLGQKECHVDKALHGVPRKERNNENAGGQRNAEGGQYGA